MKCECCNLEKTKHGYSDVVCEDCCNSLILGQPNNVNGFYVDYGLQKQIGESNFGKLHYPKRCRGD